jgi:hypothetical protein
VQFGITIGVKRLQYKAPALKHKINVNRFGGVWINKGSGERVEAERD